MHNDYSVFDITGPILIGPSSSHTAGACRLANAARAIFNREIAHADITLFGSFAQTLFGHGTDKAIIGGLLGIRPDDEQLIDAPALAKTKHMTYRFLASDTVQTSANVVRFEMTSSEDEAMSVRGVSTGGGNIIVNQIGTTGLQISLKYNTIVVDHLDKPGAVLGVSKILADDGINIASMNMYRHGKHDRAYMIIETDEDIPPKTLAEIRSLRKMSVIYIPKLY